MYCGQVWSLMFEFVFADFASAISTLPCHANKAALIEGREVRG